MTLADLKKGESCSIKTVEAEGSLLQKLLDMGFVPNATIDVIREAPLYDPMELKIKDYILSLRKSEAELIQVHCGQSIQQKVN